MDIKNLHLYVDSKDNYGEEKNCFVVNPKRLYSVWCCSNSIFQDCIIKRSDSIYLNRVNLIQVREKLVPLGKLTIYVDESVEVLQDVEADNILASVEAAGFVDIEKEEDVTYEEDGKEISTIAITAVKPKVPVDDIEATLVTENYRDDNSYE